MDIPKQPIKTEQALSPNNLQTIHQQPTVSEIQDLKLEAGKIYTATVVGKEANSEQNLKSSVNIGSNEPKPGDSKAINPENKEWLISVKGKLILINSEKPLEIGQKLLLKLETASDGKTNLIAQLLNAKAALNSSSSSSNFPQVQHSTQIIATQQLNQTLSTTSQSTDASIKTLLQALSFTLDKQLPLQHGFQQLTHLLNLPETTSANKDNLKIIETIKSTLVNKLPKLSDIISPNNETKNMQNQVIKQSLLDSGLFLEKTLLSQPEKLQLFKEKLISLESYPLQNQTKNTHTSIGSGNNILEAYSPAIQKIQQTIDKLLQLSAHNSDASSSKQTSASPASMNDLKANLIALTSSLNKQLSSELSPAELKSIFTSSITEDFLPSPFAFPILSHTNLSTSSKALFDKQELSAGQILKLLAGMIHKLQFNQLQSVLQSSAGNENTLQQTWFFELPVLHSNQSIQTFNFRIDKEHDDTNNEKADQQEQAIQWKLLLSFNLDTLGPIYVLVKLSQNHISSELWADKESTVSLLQQESEYFRTQLEKIGLEVGEVLCKKGQPNQTTTKLDRHLVDTKA